MQRERSNSLALNEMLMDDFSSRNGILGVFVHSAKVKT